MSYELWDNAIEDGCLFRSHFKDDYSFRPRFWSGNKTSARIRLLGEVDEVCRSIYI